MSSQESTLLTPSLELQPDASFVERYEAAQKYIDSLAKPMGSLGTLEEWAARLSALYKNQRPAAFNPYCLIFAADHGVAASPENGGESCSAFPQLVTQSIVLALHQNVAGATTLCTANNVGLKVVDVGVLGSREYGTCVVEGTFRLANGTRNACVEAAMTLDEVDKLLQAGRDAVKEYATSGNASVLCIGEVGIGNTTTSSILLAAITGKDITDLVDGGATVGKQADTAVVEKKRDIVSRALARFHSKVGEQPDIRTILAELGGAEMVAMAGAVLEAAEQDLPVLVDGFIASTAALTACLLKPDTTKVLFFATQSTERGHIAALEKMASIAKEQGLPAHGKPALDMGLRFGEGTGAIMATPLFQSALGLLSDMATLQHILSQLAP
eukprot:Nitzschia sp. Nitz4//scaffold2_size372955//308999//310153//NITZ4_000460-RA/size372955-processed-gene-0.450-mRNA-1//1//CDS//3329546889//7460//frame0